MPGLRSHLQDLLLVCTCVAAVGAAVLSWCAAWLSGLLTHTAPPHVTLSIAAAALPHLIAHPLDTTGAYQHAGGRGVGGPLVFWPIMLGLTGGAAYGSTRGWRLARGWLHHGDDGLADRSELAAVLGERHALAMARTLRPGLKGRLQDIQVNQVAVSCGVAVPYELPLWLPVEESVTVVAPPRSGKTSQLIVPALIDWPGPALVTSARSDVLFQTAKIRVDRGHPVHVMDPYDVAGWPSTVRWSLTEGCADYGIVQRRTEALMAATRSEENTKNGGYFVNNAKIMINCWLHAAGLENLSARHVLDWITNPDNRRPIEILSTHRKTQMANMLGSFYTGDSEEKASSWKTAFQPFAALLNPRVADIFAADPADSIHLNGWLASGATIYLIGEEDDQSLLSPLLAAFGRAAMDTAKHGAARTLSGRLDPPLALIGDELANCMPLPELPQLISLAGGFNIFVLASLQNLGQAERRWGPLGARQIISGATAKIILGGISDPKELKLFSDMIGEYDEPQTALTEDRDRVSLQTSIRRRPVLDMGMIRMIPERSGVVVHRAAAATRVRFVRAHEGPHAQAIAAAKQWAGHQLRERGAA
ncbi:type IV secretory system conjugative DNA transfer family protein [Spirillospora sp. CA-128828]|uniref:type IV secretory system conjugative DNA transfer family protein n=1 Tax=Spirillospora sp. CA-128828 TaxID=3240033 RepID=UPI003D8B4404